MQPNKYTVEGPDGKFTTIRTCGGEVEAARMCYPGLFANESVSWACADGRTTVSTSQDMFFVWKLR